MGWGHCGVDDKGREIGYAIPATCDLEGCETKIDRGLSYVCGGMHESGDADGCGGYFCAAHLTCGIGPQKCPACFAEAQERVDRASLDLLDACEAVAEFRWDRYADPGEAVKAFAPVAARVRKAYVLAMGY